MTDPVWPSQPEWGAPPSLAWASDNPRAAQAIWQLCGGEPYFATVVDEDAHAAFAARGRPDPPPPVGAVVCVLGDGRTYVVAPDAAGATDDERVRSIGTYRGDVSGLAGGA
jgi:hypothetical protein